MRTRLKDVVARAGVSASLISNYLNGRSCARMSEATRQRIEEALTALDYRECDAPLMPSEQIRFFLQFS